MPGASATGKLTNSPIAIVKMPPAKAVARNTEFQLRPDADRMPGLTAKI